MQNAVGSVQSVLVLGGGSDIARATVERLVDRGTRTVVLAARRPEELTEVVEALRRRGAERVETVRFEARDTSSHDALLDEVTELVGDVDLALLAWGVLGDQATFDHDADVAVQAVEANYVGAVSIGLRLADRMRAQGHGVIVVLSSVAGERVRKANFVYGSSKAGLDGFSTGLGDALAGSGAHVLLVRPGFVHTKMTEGMEAAPFSTTPEAVADDIVRGLERGAEVVWSPPKLRLVMSVLRHLPRAVFRRLPA